MQALLSAGVGPSFNSVTVDSDTSTSDTLLLFATGAAEADGQPRIEDAATMRGLHGFRAALNDLLMDLALQVVRDGEGARKMVAVTVTGAESDAAAKTIALSIANSPLVKTAVAGEDANWGRVVMAVGKSGEMADRDKLAIWFGDVRVAVDGERDPAYSEAAATAVMERAGHSGAGRYRPRLWQGDGLYLRPDQGICRHQRRLPELSSVIGSSNCPPSGGWRRRAFGPGRPNWSNLTAAGSGG